MNDFLTEIEFVGLTSRLKRLSDALLYSTKELYKSEGLDIEPNWNLIFILLQENEAMTITEISEKLQFSHPAVVKIINKMKKNGHVETKTDDQDKRRQILTLTEKAHRQLPLFEKYWTAGRQTVMNLLEDSPNFLEEFLKIEEKVNQSDYKERTLKNLKNDKLSN